MDQSLPWQVNSHLAVKKFSPFHWTRNPTLVPLLNNKNPVHTFTSYFPKIHSNIIFPSTLTYSEWTLHFPITICYAFLISPIRATFPAHLIFLDLITLIIHGQVYKLWSSSLCSLLQPHATSSLLGTNIPLSTCSQIPSMFFPRCKRLSFTPIQKTRKITALYVLTSNFSERMQDDKIFWTEQQQALCERSVCNTYDGKSKSKGILKKAYRYTEK
jgi:hypothetical protein